MGVSCDDIWLLERDYLIILLSDRGHTMIWMITLTAVASAGWTVEWAQRRCEQWAQMRDKDL
jgi:hypothetical protein